MAYDMRLALMCGADIPVPECQLTVHQPRISEIALIGEADFFTAIQTLCIQKNMITQGETLLTNTNNFQIFMTIMQEKETIDKKEAVKQLFPLIFPQYKTSITPRSIILSLDNQIITIDEKNFDALQKVLIDIFCIKTGPMETQAFNPGDKRAQEIANKLMRARQRVAAQKGDGENSIFSQYISVITVGLESMSLYDCEKLTMFQLFDLIERYSLYVNWDLDIRSRLAGGKPESKPDNWMKNIH